MTLITADSDVISMRINVSWFAVSGLDTFTSFDVLEPISNFTIGICLPWIALSVRSEL